MPLSVGTSGGNKAVATMTVGTSGGNKAVLVGTIGTSGGNKVFYQALSASAAPASVSGLSATNPISSGASTVTVTGGVGPFTYLWSQVNGDPMTINSPAGSSTNFFSNSVPPATTYFGDFTCLVTDTGTGLTTTSNNVNVQLTRT